MMKQYYNMEKGAEEESNPAQLNTCIIYLHNRRMKFTVTEWFDVRRRCNLRWILFFDVGVLSFCHILLNSFEIAVYQTASRGSTIRPTNKHRLCVLQTR